MLLFLCAQDIKHVRLEWSEMKYEYSKCIG